MTISLSLSLSLSLSICVCVYVCVRMSAFLDVCLSYCQSTHTHTYLDVSGGGGCRSAAYMGAAISLRYVSPHNSTYYSHSIILEILQCVLMSIACIVCSSEYSTCNVL